MILPVEMSCVFLFVFMCLAHTGIDKFYLCWSLPFYTPLYSLIDAIGHKGSVCSSYAKCEMYSCWLVLLPKLWLQQVQYFFVVLITDLLV